MKYVIFGGGGHVARHFARLATKAGHQVVSVVRNDDHSADLTALGATPAVLSIEAKNTAEIADFLSSQRPDGVIFAAGAGGKGGPERTRAVDYGGACKVFSACEASGVKRLLLVSAIDVRDRSKPVPSWYSPESCTASDRVWDAIGTYMQAKYDSEVALHLTSLDWTVVRPGRLTHEPAGHVDVGRTQMGAVSREAVAAVLLACALEPLTTKLTLDVIDGSQEVTDAVAECAANKIDAWTG